MIRTKTDRKPIIDLTGPQGNAFYLIGSAKGFHSDLTRQGIELPPFKEIQTEMMSGDYENLLQVFDSHFGQFVILER
jgi:hypothetical protein